MSGPLSGLADWITDVIEYAGYLGVGVLVALANVVPPIPVEAILPLAGFVAGEGRLWFPLVVVAATVGSVAGALALYALGYWLGEARVRKFVRRYGRFLFLKEADLNRAQLWFDRHGGKVVVVGRVLPGARKIVPIPAGIARMPVGRFVAYTAFANYLSNSVLVGLGWVLGERWEIMRPYVQLLEYVILVGLAAIVLLHVRRRWSARG